jgi:hypothetical protein
MTKRFVREADEPRKNQSTADKLIADFAEMDRQIDAREANRKKRRKRAQIPFPELRLRNIEKVMSDLYGSVLPEGDDGAMVDLEILIATVIAAGKSPMSFMRKWVSLWMSQDDAERFVGGVPLKNARKPRRPAGRSRNKSWRPRSAGHANRCDDRPMSGVAYELGSRLPVES